MRHASRDFPVKREKIGKKLFRVVIDGFEFDFVLVNSSAIQWREFICRRLDFCRVKRGGKLYQDLFIKL